MRLCLWCCGQEPSPAQSQHHHGSAVTGGMQWCRQQQVQVVVCSSAQPSQAAAAGHKQQVVLAAAAAAASGVLSGSSSLDVPCVNVMTPTELARDLFQWVHDEEVVDAPYLQVRVWVCWVCVLNFKHVCVSVCVGREVVWLT